MPIPVTVALQLPPWAISWPALLVLGLIGGAVAMLVYRAISPQQRIGSLAAQAGEARKALGQYDGDDPRELIRRVGAALRPALLRIALVIGPALVAMLPVIGMIAAVRTAPHWEWPFLAGLTASTLALKFGLKIH